MVGAAGIVASTINNRHQRRESRTSQCGDNERQHGGSRATISEAVTSRIVPAPPSTSCGPGGGGTMNHGHHCNSYNASTTNPNNSYNLSSNNNPSCTKDGEMVMPEKLSLKEQVKFYVSLTLGILASICVFALLFLIPLVVEPSISTLLADFDPRAATCVTIDYTYATGLSKCGLWSSCREGCTSTPSQCHQIYINYRKSQKPGYAPIENFTILEPQEYMDESHWDVAYTQLLVNAKGCGYPPRVKCDEYGDIYGQVGRTFPCYYSRANPRLVVTDYNWQETAYPLLISLGLPTSLFAVSIAVLSFWYCPSCEERGKNKRPCRSRYHVPKTHDDFLEKSSRKDKRSDPIPIPQPQIPIVQQPRGKHSTYRPNSPSLATISSRDTTVSSVSSLDDGWQSPPSPPPRMNPRMDSSKSNVTTRARKL